MRIDIVKGKRSVRLRVRERQVLEEAKGILAELAVTGGGDIARESEEAAEYIQGTLDALDGKPVINLQEEEVVNAPY